MNNQSDFIEIDVLHLLNVIWHKIWIVVIAAALCGAIAFSYASFFITPKYEASALMYVNNSSISVGSTSISLNSSGDIGAARNLVSTYLVILKTRSTLTDVIEKANLPYSYEQLSGMVSASSVNSTEIFRVTVTSSNPQEAATIANTIAEVLPGQISGILDGSSPRVVDYAVVPTGKISPNVTRYTTMGLIIGALISCLGIVIVDLCDDVVHGIDSLPDLENMPVLAEIPNLEETGKGSGYRSYNSYYKSKEAYAGVSK